MDINNIEVLKPAVAMLTDLLTITGTYVDQYYNVFLNPTPMDNIEIKAYGSDGLITTVEIPNLAYLRQNCIIGEGSPEGVVEAPLGTFYLDSTVATGGLYIKQGNEIEISNTGWALLCTQETLQNIQDEIENLRETLTEEVMNLVSDSYQNLSARGQADGYVPLNDNTKIDPSFLPDNIA